jgi:hypothetical protein
VDKMLEEYLISEGYADNYKSAQKIVEAMSDLWYSELMEAMVPWRERRGNRPSPSEIAAQTRARTSRAATEIRTGRKKGDFIQTTKNLGRITQAINKLNVENPVPQTKGMTGRSATREGGKPQTTRGGMTRTGGTVSANRPSQRERLANAATRETGISHRTTSTGIPLNSLGGMEKTSWQPNPAGRTSGARVTSTGGRLPRTP